MQGSGDEKEKNGTPPATDAAARKRTVSISADELLKLREMAAPVYDESMFKTVEDNPPKIDPAEMAPERAEATQARRTRAMDNENLPRAWRFLFESRYRIGKEIGRGGMGVVHEAFDRSVGRFVAIKLLKDPQKKDKRDLMKLVREIQITGQLEHPNIMPIYDVGVLQDNRLFFVMKYIRGKNLLDIVLEMASGNRQVEENYPLRKLVTIFYNVCQAVEFAHSKGVIHRDLKVENVMVGDHGEVLVLDWGLAMIKDFFDSDDSEQIVVRSPEKMVRAISVGKTSNGSVIGTPCYLSPEQARGLVKEVDELTDIFCLGGTLYELLTLTPPYIGADAREVIDRAKLGKVELPSSRAYDRLVPLELELICLKAMAPEKKNRYQSVQELMRDINRYLEGAAEKERREKASEEALSGGLDKLADYYVVKSKYNDLKKETMRLELNARKGGVSYEEKEILWDSQDKLQKLSLEKTALFGQVLRSLQNAFTLNPQNQSPRKALFDVYYDCYIEAENESRLEDALFYKSMLELYADETTIWRLDGIGEVDLQSEPPGAGVTIEPLAEKRMRLLPTGERYEAGETPCKIKLKRGHYVITIKSRGCADAIYPVFVERSKKFQIISKLLPESDVLPGFALVPAGESTLGGEDDGTFGALPKHALYIPDFCIQKLPVTMSEYAEFINDSASTMSEEQLLDALPQVLGANRPFFKKYDDGKWNVVDVDDDGDRYSPQWPVFGVTFNHALAYARWRSIKDGVDYRLPRYLEREKAGRGCDGRLYPWGNKFDPEFCHMRFSRHKTSKPQPQDVGANENDKSPYGVYDLSGNIRNWCDSWFDSDKTARVIRGGSWSLYDMFCRLKCRASAKPNARDVNTGFRLAYSPPLKKTIRNVPL